MVIPQENPKPSAKVVRADDFASAIAMALADPSLIVEVFVASWRFVDGFRAQAPELVLSGRIRIHHGAALDVLPRAPIERTQRLAQVIASPWCLGPASHLNQASHRKVAS